MLLDGILYGGAQVRHHIPVWNGGVAGDC
jgi:hypothetical protein